MTASLPSLRAVRVRAPAHGDAASLRRLARRLGEDPDAAARRGAESRPRAALRRQRQALLDDPERRIEAALRKGEGVVAGRRVGRALLCAAERLRSQKDARGLEQAMASARAAGGDQEAFVRDGFEAALAPFAAAVEDQIALFRRLDRRDRFRFALGEILGGEIDALRAQGAAAPEAASLLEERADLTRSLPFGQGDLAEIGLSLAVDRAGDPALSRALLEAAGRLASSAPKAAAALRPLALAVVEAAALEEARAALRSRDPKRIEAALEPRDLSLETPEAFSGPADWLETEALMAALAPSAEDAGDAQSAQGRDAVS